MWLEPSAGDENPSRTEANVAAQDGFEEEINFKQPVKYCSAGFGKLASSSIIIHSLRPPEKKERKIKTRPNHTVCAARTFVRLLTPRSRFNFKPFEVWPGVTRFSKSLPMC